MSDCLGLVSEVKDSLTREGAYHHCMIGEGWDYVDEQGNPIAKHQRKK